MPGPLIVLWSFGLLFASLLAWACADGAWRLLRRFRAKRAAARVWRVSA